MNINPQPVSNHVVHSGAEHGGITLKGVNTKARPYMGAWATPGPIHKAPGYVDPGAKPKPYAQPKDFKTPSTPRSIGKNYLA